ncbi:MAG: hypothetical protein ISN28_14550 [Ectothiorhodospiraceae bacterium AqS1]|nr:hypothetical protein [Ectothiorhodospiraceae bacterium AqS1]
MKRICFAILVFGASVGAQGASVDLAETPRTLLQTAKVETVCDETQCCKNDPYDGAQYCWPRTTSELNATQPTVMIAESPSFGLGGDTLRIPTDTGITERLGATQMALESMDSVNSLLSCTEECYEVHGPDGYYYDSCIANCHEESKKASVDSLNATQPTVMIAEGGCVVNDQGEEVCHGEDGSVIGSAQGTNATTRFASSIRIGDPQPVCDTDAWACFTDTDNESPMIRDVGIFGVFASNRPCMHPSCD